MHTAKKPSVLVCVTGQYDCDRLIEAGFEKASEMGWDLHVLCVHTPVNDLSALSDEIEYLYRTAKSLGADMTIAFNHHAPGFAAQFARKVYARQVVTGIPDNRPNGFVLTLHELLPRLQITMVTKENEWLFYSLEDEQRTLA
jgi:K+-sensing histidine kinase KdpD